MDNKIIRRQKIKYRIRKSVIGTAERPRLSVFRSNTEIYAQLIDDANGVTLGSANSRSKEVVASKVPKLEQSKIVGEAIAKIAISKGISKVVFDRGGYLYHGRIKSLAEGAREGGLNF